FRLRDPSILAKADADPKRKMALLFRWYLGLSSHWANRGVPDRKEDYQIWCGPGIGAFNSWTRGTFMEAPERRGAALVSRNILAMAGVLIRQRVWQSQGVSWPLRQEDLRPREEQDLENTLNGTDP
ncbi:MAG TPA: 2-nitropropane dioxygenase, partial [Candidatus Hydrogenedentes bacterium]|nr:2-nitropropane dioxygenase [Candidatus Hydrogenedentota bacterium]